MEQLQKPLFIRRLGAFLIDHFIFSLLIPIVLFLDFDSVDFSSIFNKLIICISIFGLYCCKDIINGRSIGKRAFGLAVRDDNFNVPKISKLIIRNIFTFIWPVELVLILASKQKQKMGDRLVHTDVFMVKKNNNILGMIVSIISVVITFICILILGIIQMIKNDDSYRVATNYIMTSSEIREVVGDDISFGCFPMGSIQYANGYGNSEFTIKVKGNKETISVHVVLTKNPNSNWVIEDFNSSRLPS